MKEALFYEKGDGSRVRCRLCRFNCIIEEGGRGICAVRENRGGILFSLVYGKVIAGNKDPIEKKPLFHVLPGSSALSVATAGCNFHCRHCQNYSISQVERKSDPAGIIRTPEDIVRSAIASDCRSIAYTYTEPTVFYEFALDTAVRAREAGILNVFVTNGYINRAPLQKIAPFLSAANIDLKGFSESFYRDVVGAKLSEVLDSIVEYRRLGIWLEITTLIIPGLNDSDADLKGIADFMVRNLGADTPWHVSQFYPTYRMTDRPRTPLATIERAVSIGRGAGLHYVYEGNVPEAGGENSSCPSCGVLLIKRSGFQVTANRLIKGKCPECETAISGIWL